MTMHNNPPPVLAQSTEVSEVFDLRSLVQSVLRDHGCRCWARIVVADALLGSQPFVNVTHDPRCEMVFWPWGATFHPVDEHLYEFSNRRPGEDARKVAARRWRLTIETSD